MNPDPSSAASPAPNLAVSGRELRDLKARAQRLDPVLKVGKAGLSDAFYHALDQALALHQLVKIKFDDFKDQKKELVPQMVVRSGAQLIQRVGNVAVLYRRNPSAKPAAKAARADLDAED